MVVGGFSTGGVPARKRPCYPWPLILQDSKNQTVRTAGERVTNTIALEGGDMGERLLTDLAEATGLPSDLVTDELGRLIQGAGLAKSDITLDDLRAILADYMQEILLSAKEEISP
jgi:hypothetical protein